MPLLPTLFSGRSPLLTTTLQAVCINILANIIAQFIEFRQIQKALHLGPDHALELLALDLKDPVFRIDRLRVLQFVIWTCLNVPPNFRWQQWLERRFPAYYVEEKEKAGLELEEGLATVRTKKRNFKHTFLKILCDQGCAAPINCSLFLSVMTLLKGGSLVDAIQTIRTKFWPLKFAGWRIWPLVGLINFTFVPVERRVIVSTIIGLCWNVFLVLFIS